MKKQVIKINGKEFLQSGQTTLAVNEGRMWLNGEELAAYQGYKNQTREEQTKQNKDMPTRKKVRK
ncbi:hypothetical protein CN918_26790 [Priestia megaterium]|nr:hypothetical protein CN918_26790 [Priestia megaterium]